MELNVKDRKILYELSRDARLSAAKIAKKAGISKDVAVYSINKMISRSIIKRLITLIDTERLGFTRYEVFIRLWNTDKDAEKKLIDYLVDHPMSLWVRSSLGDWDILSEFYVRNPSEYESIIRDMTSRFKSCIRSIDSSVVISEYSFPLKCIGYRKEELLEEQDTSGISLDDKDYVILRRLSSDARANVIDIAKEAKLSSDAVIYRIRNMLKSGVIKGYRVVIDESHLGYGKYKLVLKMKSLDDKSYNSLLTFMKLHPSSQYIKRCVGNWDFSITLLAKDQEDLRKIISDIKSNLKENLDDYKILMMFEEHKNTYFPEGVTSS